MRISSRVLACVILLCPAPLLAEESQEAGGGPGKSPFQVQGRVVDEADRPVAGALVESLREAERATARTDDAGRFLLDLPRKPQALLLRASEAAGTRQAFAGRVLNENFRSLYGIQTILSGDVKLTLRPPRRIAAAVIDGAKRPVADADVLVDATWFQKLAEAKTDEAGKATLVVPVDAPLSSIVAKKSGAGLDYFLYQSPDASKNAGYRLSLDRAEPVTLVLNGTRQVKMHVVNERGQPMPGVPVCPISLEKPRKGDNLEARNLAERAVLHTSGLSDFNVTTHQDGQATFDFLPVDCTRSIFFLARARGYGALERKAVGAGAADAEITIQLTPVIPLRGQVSFGDGRPAAGARVWIFGQPMDEGRAAGGLARRRSSGVGSWTLYSDDRGHFEVEVYPNHFYWMNVSLERWAAPLTVRAVLGETPKDETELVLQKATRVYGRLTVGPDRRPVAGQQVVVLQHAEDECRKLGDSDLSPDSKETSARKDGETDVKLFARSAANTREQGEFEVFLGPGKYQLRYAGEPVTELELEGEAEHEIDLHAERASHEEFTGRAVLDGPEQQGVADARVVACYLAEALEQRITTTAAADGAFHFYRRPLEMLIYATSEDDSLAGVVRVNADVNSAVVPLRAAASARGRLIDATTGKGVPNALVYYGVSPAGLWSRDGYGSVRTDEQGEFTAAGLAPGWKYEFWLAPRRGPPVGGLPISVTPDGAERIDLGDVKAP